MVRVTWINGTFLFGRPQLSDNVTYKTFGYLDSCRFKDHLLQWLPSIIFFFFFWRNDYLQYLDLLPFTFEKWGALKWHWFSYNRVDSSLWACSYCLITYYDYMAYKYVTIISIVPKKKILIVHLAGSVCSEQHPPSRSPSLYWWSCT